MIVLGVQILLGGVVHTVIQPNMEQLTDEVRDGKLDFALTKPEDAQLSSRCAAPAVAVREVLSRRDRDRRRARASRRAHRRRPCARLLRAARARRAPRLLLLARPRDRRVLVVNTWFFADMFEGLCQVGRWPIGIYPGWLRYSMTYLVPIGFAVTVPAQARDASAALAHRRDRPRLRRSCSRRLHAGSGGSG